MTDAASASVRLHGGGRAETAVPRLWADAQARTAIATIIWVYLATFLVFAALSFLRGQFSARVVIGMGVPMMLEGLLELLPYTALRLTVGRRARARWPLIVAAALVDSVGAALWDTQLRAWTGQLLVDYHDGRFWNGVVRALPVDLWHTGMLVALFAFQEAFYQLGEQQRRLDASRASERGAHLAALRLQLNPHFLFNTMNALSSLVVTGRSREAETMIERLSAFLRATLTSDPTTLVHLDEEFETLQTYLDVESVRFGDRLRATLDLPPALGAVRVPPFLLQPLVENAVKYAVAPARRPVTITVSARPTPEGIALVVEDDGDGADAVVGGTGVGLTNVRQRLALEYGTAARLEFGRRERGYCAAIVIPAPSAVA